MSALNIFFITMILVVGIAGILYFLNSKKKMSHLKTGNSDLTNRLNKAQSKNENQYKELRKLKGKVDAFEVDMGLIDVEKKKVKEKNEKVWKLNEIVYKEKKAIEERNDKLQNEKRILEEEKVKVKEKIKRLWKQSISIHEEKERINVLKLDIEEKHKSIMDSINYARRIQEAMLPPKEQIQKHLNDFFVFYRPKELVSGDFYWIQPKDERVYISAVDCTGHGVPGAFMSFIGYVGLNQSITEHKLEHPGEILNKLNEIVAETLHQTEHTEVRDGMDMALCNINIKEMVLEYAGAQNALYIVRKNQINLKENEMTLEPILQNIDYSLYKIKADKHSIGASEETYHFSNHELNIEKGDAIYIFSDGFADQFGGPSAKKFKYGPFRQLLLGIQDKSMEEQKVILEKTFDDWKGNLEQVDDICVMGIRI